MTKKWLCLLLVLALLPVWSMTALADSVETVEIRDAEGLRAMAADPSGSYVLAANINMDGVDWTPMAFSGTLDGAGYCIYNLSVNTVGTERETTVDGNHKEYDSVFAGMFSVLKNATVKNLTLKNARIHVKSDEDCFAALLAGYVENAVIEDCVLDGSVELHSGGTMVGVGGIAGFGTAEFKSCDVKSELIHVDEKLDGKCEQFTGGVLACGYCSINGSTVHIEGYTSCHGYVHDGGLVGMHHQHNDAGGSVVLYSSANKLSGFITFFEDNADRRAYCAADCGENLHWTMSVDGLQSTFEPREVHEYTKDLYPHDCANTEFGTVVTAPTCTDWGFTTYACPDCGYSYQDDFAEPGHMPGEWETVTEATFEESGEQQRLCQLCGKVVDKREIAPHVAGEWVVTQEPAYEQDGIRQQHCSDCGVLLAEESIPALIRSTALILNETELKLNYKGAAILRATIQPDNVTERGYSWQSSDESVVTVDADGFVTAVAPGSAVITCSASDGGAVSECAVRVRYSFGQHCIRIFLLGFLWY